MRTIRIFIASSSELLQDREALELLFARMTQRLIKDGVNIETVIWENFLDSVSLTRKQDDYNAELKKSDIVISLFYTKAGKYTLEEFNTALAHFHQTGAPLIYTYFKEPDTTEPTGTEITTGSADTPDLAAGRESLEAFKKQLHQLGHFYTRYKSTEELKFKFREQLDILDYNGFIQLKKAKIEETKEAVTQYIQHIQVANIVGDGNTVVQGDHNIVIQGLTQDGLTLLINGISKQVSNRLDALVELGKKESLKKIRIEGREIELEGLDETNYRYFIDRLTKTRALPDELKENLLTESSQWVGSLEQALDQMEVSYSTTDHSTVFKQYGWLVQDYLRKFITLALKSQTLRRLSFLAEAYQASLRFLSFVQLSQLMKLDIKAQHPVVSEFIMLPNGEHIHYDYSNLLLVTTGLLKDSDLFMPEIQAFVQELSDTGSDLYHTSLFLENYRNRLIGKECKDDENLPALLDEYLTALVFWLRKLTFISQYRMVSIKDIKLKYRLGSHVVFEHIYGELNAMYNGDLDNDVSTTTSKRSIKEVYTYNQSVLLLKGKNIDASLDNIRETGAYLSLSPLVIDQSVFSDMAKQTPEIYYYTGFDAAKKQYSFARFNNELPVFGQENVMSNKELWLKSTNLNLPALDTLFIQLDSLLKPFKSKDR